MVSVLRAAFRIFCWVGGRLVGWPGPFSVQHARNARNRTSDQKIRHDGAHHRHDQQLHGVERPQDKDLVSGVEHASDDEDLAEILQPGA